MSKPFAKTSQADIARAIRAVQQTKAKMAVEVAPDGTIRIVPVEQARKVDFPEDFKL